MNILNHFKLLNEQEDFNVVIENIDKRVVFKGTNLWVLVFAIFIASLGLNMNSTAVIIGAMLISPLMEPIMGIGLGMSINDLGLLKKSAYNFLFAVVVSLLTSFVYFSISPLSEAHSEILSRTSPNIYDVLIALFGGLAGFLTIASKQKGNVIPGVAIATALMPPLCTAGYGLATLNFNFFFGAFYLFLINSVFIAFATLITARILKFPYKHLRKQSDEKRSKRIIWSVVIVTLLPSIYMGFDIVQQSRFTEKANSFIENEAVFPNDYLLKKEIDAKKKTITLTYGGQLIERNEIEALANKLTKYNISKKALTVQQGFSYLKESAEIRQIEQLAKTILLKDNEINLLKSQLDSLNECSILNKQLFRELKTQYPELKSLLIQSAFIIDENSASKIWISVLKSDETLTEKTKPKLRTG